VYLGIFCGLLSKYGNFRIFFLQIWWLWRVLFKKKSLCMSHNWIFWVAKGWKFAKNKTLELSRKNWQWITGFWVVLSIFKRQLGLVSYNISRALSF
jgi:hypothetical protein